MIKGSTELVAIVGSPVSQVKSPDNFNRWFAEQGQDVAMLPIDLAADALDAFIGTLRGWQNLRGCVVTVPYKQALASRVDALSERAALLGSINVIRREADGRLVGDMVDGDGFIKAAAQHGFDAAGRQALIVGSGGVGSAIAHALCQAGLARLVISDLSEARAKALGDLLRGAFRHVQISHQLTSLEGFDLVVNGSPVGMGAAEDGPLPLPAALLDTLQPATLVADVVTSPTLTPLLALARRRGCRIQTGAEMARAQMGNLGHFMGVTPLAI